MGDGELTGPHFPKGVGIRGGVRSGGSVRSVRGMGEQPPTNNQPLTNDN